MRFVFLASAALCVLLWTSTEAQGQAGRYIPIPRVPSGGNGGVPHIPFFHGSSGEGLLWVIVTIAGFVTLARVGWMLGQALGRRERPAPPNTGQSPLPPDDPPRQDLILQPDEVEEKASKTTRLLEELANRDAAFNPCALRALITATFTRVQQCWEARDYGPVRELLGPAILAQHEEMLRAMGRNREINRIEDLRVRRLEIVHVCCPAEADHHEVTALITFEARVYFVEEVTNAFLRGSHQVGLYQEFWTFRRQKLDWRLQTIEKSHESGRLQAENHIDETAAGLAPHA